MRYTTRSTTRKDHLLPVIFATVFSVGSLLMFLFWKFYYLPKTRELNSKQVGAFQEPLQSWTRMACVAIDGGTSWLDSPANDCQAMLRNDWEIVDAASLQKQQHAFLSKPANAWDDVRMMRILMAGHKAGYVNAATLWQGLLVFSQRLQTQYTGFDAIWRSFVSGKRAWQSLASNGSQDDATLVHHLKNIERWNNRAALVDYRAKLTLSK
jgi:hypothetical protein